jgi:catechol 2,3-dioxygenase-like lactoylglutathione lyase family enzyme
MVSVRYMVSDVEEAVQFYTGLLGFSLVEQFGPAMAIVEREGATLWLAGPSSSAARPLPNGAQPVPGGWNRIVLAVDDLEEMVAQLRAKGVRFRNEPLSGPGGAQVLIEDPSGNPIELFQPRSR